MSHWNLFTPSEVYPSISLEQSQQILMILLGTQGKPSVFLLFLVKPPSFILLFQSSMNFWKNHPSPAHFSLTTTNCLWSQTQTMVVIRTAPRSFCKRPSGQIPSFLIFFLTSLNFWNCYQYLFVYPYSETILSLLRFSLPSRTRSVIYKISDSLYLH